MIKRRLFTSRLFFPLSILSQEENHIATWYYSNNCRERMTLYFHSAIKVRYIPTPHAVVNLSRFTLLSPRQRCVALICIGQMWLPRYTLPRKRSCSLVVNSIPRSRLVSKSASFRQIWSCKFVVGSRGCIADHDTSFNTRRVGVDTTSRSGSRIIRASMNPMMSHRVRKFIRRCAISIPESVC